MSGSCSRCGDAMRPTSGAAFAMSAMGSGSVGSIAEVLCDECAQGVSDYLEADDA